MFYILVQRLIYILINLLIDMTIFLTERSNGRSMRM